MVGKIIIILVTFISIGVFFKSYLLIRFEETQSFDERNNDFANYSKLLINIAVIFILVILSIKLLSNNLTYNVDSMNIGGFNILFSKPDTIFEQHMRNYLNTKRTLFFIDPSIDNFSETLNSYYDTYNFIRAELQIYPPDISVKSQTYKDSQKIIFKLNQFLTNYQNNYRRWFDYEISSNSKDNFNIDIGEIQKKYRYYDRLVDGFNDINKAFRYYGWHLKVDFMKWAK